MVKLFANYKFKLLEIAQRLAEYCQIGENLPNLVTLLLSGTQEATF